ncbi:MAG: site-specific DNA-methyltransferase [Hyphomicrobiales bacterium]|nr:site-specific DNA-methyltransferase [Hyphomicrobiales bacterium]
MPDQSVNCCVTSPPYFGLRDYGVDGQMGLEETPDEYVAGMAEVFREVRRVLRDDGTLWVNLGDSYASAWACNRQNVIAAGSLKKGKRKDRPNRLVNGLKEKDLIGIPWRVAFALQADGWYLRQDIIWSKPNPMPESVTDRCTKAHEYIFMMSKSPRYHFDQEAILEPSSPNTHARLSQNVQDQIGSGRVPGKTNGTMKAVGRKFDPGKGNKNNPSFDAAMAIMPPHRNKRSVWTVTTKPFKEAHFATYPVKLIEPCILAGCPVGGMVLDPFGGAGTTAVVAAKHGRQSMLIELNSDYAEIATKRIREAYAQPDMFIEAEKDDPATQTTMDLAV